MQHPAQVPSEIVEALRESEERFRTLVQFSFDVYWETDAQHRFVLAGVRRDVG
jgi:PAS domain-containing protein